MADDVQGFFKLLLTNPKTVSLTVAIGLLSPYVAPDLIELDQPYRALSGMLGVAFLGFFLLLSIRNVADSVGASRKEKQRLREKIRRLSGDELNVLAAFVHHGQAVLVLPSNPPAVHHLWMKDILLSMQTGRGVQNFELADWAREIIEDDIELLRGTTGDFWLQVDKQTREDLENER